MLNMREASILINRSFVSKFQVILSIILTISLFALTMFFAQIVTEVRKLDSQPAGAYAVRMVDNERPLSLGDLRVPDRSIFFHASFDFAVKNSGFTPNILQTDGGNGGLRIELAGDDLIAVASRASTGSFKIVIGKVEIGKTHHIEINALDHGYVSVKLDEQPWHSKAHRAISMAGSDFRIGDSLGSSKNYQVNIQNFKIELKSAILRKEACIIVIAIGFLLTMPLLFIFWNHRRLMGSALKLSLKGVLSKKFLLRRPSAPSAFPIAWLCLVPPVVTALYTASYSFAYFPITEGWFSVYVDAFRHGRFFYRDINLLLPPAYPLTLLAIGSLFGDGFWILRLFGVFLMAVFAVVLFDILRFVFDRWVAAFVAVVATIYYQSGNAFIGYDFTQFVTFYMLLGCLGIIRYVYSKNPSFLFLSGFVLALATLTKQSNGGIVSIGMTFVVFFTILYIFKPLLIRHLAFYFLGALIPPFVMSIWLFQNHAFSAFLDQTLFHAVSAKGSSAIATGWIWRFFGNGDFVGASFSAIVFLIELLVGTLFINFINSAFVAAESQSNYPARIFADSFLGIEIAQRQRWNVKAFAAILGFFLIIFTIIAKRFNLDFKVPSVEVLKKYDLNFFFIVISFNVYCIGILFSLLRLSQKSNPRMLSLLITSAFGFLLMIGNGTSAGLSEISAFLGIAILFASGMSMASRSVIISTFIVLIAVSACGSFIHAKFSAPYNWWGISTGELVVNRCSPLPDRLSGLCGDERDVNAIRRTVAAVSSAASASDEVLSFPNIPLFALMANRQPFGRSPIPWFDFMSQAEGEALMAQMKEAPPHVIIVARLPMDVYNSHEQSFNAGAKGVHRRILRYIDNLWQENRIDLITENMIDGVNVQVFRYRSE